MNWNNKPTSSPQTLSRRQFLHSAGAALGGLGLLAAGCSGEGASGSESAAGGRRFLAEPPGPGETYLAVARGAQAAAIGRAAIQALGGIERFVKKGHQVIIKPNICADYHPPEFAVTTNPQLVGELVRLCLGAGAARVRALDYTYGGSNESAHAKSGIGPAVLEAGGEMEVLSPLKYARFEVPQGLDFKELEIYADVLEVDVLINVPIAKQHSLARLTLAGKNLLGVTAKPSSFHRNLGQRIADLLSLVRPTLTVVDAYRILVDHGPTGGSLEDVRETHTVIASADSVAADAYAASLFGLAGGDVAATKAAAEMGLGRLDLTSIKVEEIHVA